MVGAVNGAFVRLMNVPGIGAVIRRGLVVIRYTGRRSGKTFETPVGYRRSGDTVTINITAPDSKNWWRNFLDAGAPITLCNFDGCDRSGHAVAERDDKGKVTVTVRLDA